MSDQGSLTAGVQRYYDNQREDRNLLLAGETGIVNHHYSIGDFDRSRFPAGYSQQEISAILNQLELNEIDTLIAHMGDVSPSHRVLDAGCGRGGSSFTIAERFGCRVDGVTISPYQHEFAV